MYSLLAAGDINEESSFGTEPLEGDVGLGLQEPVIRAIEHPDLARKLRR